MDDPKVDLKGQCHRSKVKVTRSENVILAPLDSPASLVAIVKGFLSQGHGSRANLMSLGLRSALRYW